MNRAAGLRWFNTVLGDRKGSVRNTRVNDSKMFHSNRISWCSVSPAKTAADEEDEDHYENSFINDESEEEEVDEDSDYVPESDDSGKGEDIKRLQKEAKAFLRRRK